MPVDDPFAPAALAELPADAPAKPKRKPPVRTTQLSLAHLRKQGCTVAIVERWNAHAKITQDLFGFVDLLALHPDGTTIAVQTCARGDMSKRIAKIADSEHLPAVRRCNWRIVVHGWDKHEGKPRVKEIDVS